MLFYTNIYCRSFAAEMKGMIKQNDRIKRQVDVYKRQIHVRSACPPIMYGCKYLNFSWSVSDLELITRRVIKKLEGIEGDEIPADILAQYAASDTEKHEAMVEEIRQILKFDSLKFQKLEDTVEAIGVDRCNLCTCLLYTSRCV